MCIALSSGAGVCKEGNWEPQASGGSQADIYSGTCRRASCLPVSRAHRRLGIFRRQQRCLLVDHLPGGGSSRVCWQQRLPRVYLGATVVVGAEQVCTHVAGPGEVYAVEGKDAGTGGRAANQCFASRVVSTRQRRNKSQRYDPLGDGRD
jgi:hypothetical protein